MGLAYVHYLIAFDCCCIVCCSRSGGVQGRPEAALVLSLTAVLLRRQKGETASFHSYLSLCSKDRWPDTHLSPDRRRKERNSITQLSPSNSNPPTPFPNIFLPSSPPPLSLYHLLSFCFFHLFKSLHFRCIHTFPISLCMSLSPPLSLPQPLTTYLSLSFPPLSLHSHSFHLSLPPIFTFLLYLPPCFLPYSFPIFFPPSLPPSHYCNPSLFHQPPCKQASWFP